MLLRYTGKTSDIVSNMDNLGKTQTETVISLDNLREGLTFMAEFMPGFTNTPNMKLDALEKHLSQYFDIKISNDSSEAFLLLQRKYPDEVRQVLSQIVVKKNSEPTLRPDFELV